MHENTHAYTHTHARTLACIEKRGASRPMTSAAYTRRAAARTRLCPRPNTRTHMHTHAYTHDAHTRAHTPADEKTCLCGKSRCKKAKDLASVRVELTHALDCVRVPNKNLHVIAGGQHLK